MLVVGFGFDDVVKYFDGKEDEVKVVVINFFGSVILFGEEFIVDSILVVMIVDSVFNWKFKIGGNVYYLYYMIFIGCEYVEFLIEGIEYFCKFGLVLFNDVVCYQFIFWVFFVIFVKSIFGFGSDDFVFYWRVNFEFLVCFLEVVVGLVQNVDGVCIYVFVEIGFYFVFKSFFEQILKVVGVKNVVYVGLILK